MMRHNALPIAERPISLSVIVAALIAIFPSADTAFPLTEPGFPGPFKSFKNVCDPLAR